MNPEMHEALTEAINAVCHTPEVCGQCDGKNCLVGFSRYANNYSKKNDTPNVPNGFDEIPPIDTRGGYEDDDVLRLIAQTLYFCKSCKQDHRNNCVLALIRDCMEIILIGEEQDYEGDPVTYLKLFSEKNKTLGAALTEIYTEEKERLR